MAQIFTNPSALEETTDNVMLSSRQATEAKRLKEKLDDWQSEKQSKIIAYVGRFGSGKSTTLREVESMCKPAIKKPLWKKLFIKDSEPIWLNFEAWRYANREQLWDGFAIEAIDRVKGRKSHVKTTQAVDGISGVYGILSRHPSWSAAIIFIIGAIVASVLWWWLHNNTDVMSRWITALLKYALPVLFILAAFFGVSSIFQKKESLKRVFELENELDKALRRLKQPFVIVAEDIDRAGDEGIVFLETLRSFLNKPRKKRFEHSIIVIAPQDRTYMSVLNEDKIKGVERGIKIYDSVVYYSSSTIQEGDTTKLLDTAAIKSEYRENVIKVVGAILKDHKPNLSLRMLKFIFREAEEFAESQDKVDAALVILIASMRYIKIEDGTMQDVFRNRGMLRKSTISTNDGKQGAIHLIYDQLLAISGLGLDEHEPMYVDYRDLDEEVVGIHKEYNPSDPTTKAGFYVTLHEKYRGLLD